MTLCESHGLGQSLWPWRPPPRPPADCAQPGCDKGDLNGDCLIDLSDLSGFLGAFGAAAPDPGYVAEADFDDSGVVELGDLAGFLAVFGADCGPIVDPNEPNFATGTLTAYRPQFGTGYAPFLRTAVPENVEESATRGPGIRINTPADADPSGEDDLIEVTFSVTPPGAAADRPRIGRVVGLDDADENAGNGR